MKLFKFQNRKTRKLAVINTAIVVCTPIALAFCCIHGVSEKVTTNPAFAQGIQIDEKDVSLLNYEQTKTEFLKKEQTTLDNIVLPLSYNGSEKTYTAQELGVSTNTLEVLEQAYQYEKSAASMHDSFARLSQARSEGIVFSTGLQIDETTLRSLLESIAGQSDYDPVDASVSFDAASRSFSYSPDQPGKKLAIDAAVNAIKTRIQTGDFSPLTLEYEDIIADTTLQGLYKNTVLIGQCSTKVSNNANRNTNIQLMCNAVNGLVLQPGEILSINGLVGQRTIEKGFLPAPAIMDGKRLEDDIGGGICQLSGTLYNAALRADMTIVERVKHSFPSDYLPIGLDSTLNWDNKDLKIQNSSEYPIYIAAWLKDNTVTVELYGQPLEEGVTIEIVNDILETIQPEEPEIRYTDELKSNKTEVLIKERTGYKVKVYRNYYKNGELTQSELISSDTYKAIRGVTLKGTPKEEVVDPAPLPFPDDNVNVDGGNDDDFGAFADPSEQTTTPTEDTL